MVDPSIGFKANNLLIYYLVDESRLEGGSDNTHLKSENPKMTRKALRQGKNLVKYEFGVLGLKP